MGSFRNLAWLCMPYMLARGAALYGMRRRTGDGICQTSTPLSPLSMAKTEQVLLTQGRRVTHPSQQDISLQIPVNSFPRCHGTWCPLQHSMLIHGESWGNGCFLLLTHLEHNRCLGRGPQPGIWDNRPYWLFTEMY